MITITFPDDMTLPQRAHWLGQSINTEDGFWDDTGVWCIPSVQDKQDALQDAVEQAESDAGWDTSP
jgi:hypothetical protein